MSHELTVRENGLVEMFSAGSEPVWHQLGQRTETALTSAEAIQLAGLDWSVIEAPIQLVKPINDLRTINSHKAIIRQDNGLILGIVGRRYKPLQNEDAFEWLDSIIGEKLAVFETAGSISGGRVVWMMVRLPHELRVKGTDDVSLPYILVSNSHDGTRALRIFNCAVRVVCNNTLTLALGRGEGSGLSIRHTESINDRIADARKALGIATRNYKQMQQEMDRLAGRELTEREVTTYFFDIWPDNPEVEDTTRTRAVREQMLANFHAEDQRLPGIRATAWAAFNAVTRYTDWQRPTRGRSDQHRANNRLASIWFGDSAQVKRKAWSRALELVNN